MPPASPFLAAPWMPATIHGSRPGTGIRLPRDDGASRADTGGGTGHDCRGRFAARSSGVIKPLRLKPCADPTASSRGARAGNEPSNSDGEAGETARNGQPVAPAPQPMRGRSGTVLRAQ
jgi:hypothetical protein